MKEINIPFNKWSKERLRYTKRATTRTKKYGEIGDYFYADGTKFILNLVIKVPLWFVLQELWGSEGAVNEFELHEVWADLHPKKGVDINQMVWYHHFEIEIK